jgi:hypothetical protein
MLRMARTSTRHRDEEAVHGRRRRAQLRRQRPDAARGAVREDLDSAGRRRRRRRPGRGARSGTALLEKPRPAENGRRRHARLLPRPGFSDDEIAELPRRRRARATSAGREELVRAAWRLLAHEKVVGWFQGRWSSGRGRSAPAASWATRAAQDAVGDEPEDQVPRELPALRAERAAGAGGDYFELDATRPYMLLVAPVQESGASDDRAEQESCGASTSSTCRAPTSRPSRTSTTPRACRRSRRRPTRDYYA